MKTYKRRKSKRKTQKGGKAGHLYRIINLNDSAQILGAGSNGLIASNKDITVKLFYNCQGSEELQKEADIQIAARKLLKDIVEVPKVHEVFNQQILYKGQKYLCGISMDRVPLVTSFDYAVHILLGYKQDDTDTIWTRDYRNPPSEENPPRGFFAGVEMMEAIWQDEAGSLVIESVAYTMGLALATLIKGGIIPYDLEWIYGGDGKIYLIDFGFCEFGNVDPIKYLNHIGSWGLGGDYYIPHKGHRGYEEFMKGYSGH